MKKQILSTVCSVAILTTSPLLAESSKTKQEILSSISENTNSLSILKDISKELKKIKSLF